MRAFATYTVGFTVLCLVSCIAGCGSGGGTPPITTKNVIPAVSSLSPSSVVAGSTGLTLTVSGSNFVSGAEILWGGVSRTTVYVSSTSVQTSLTTSDLATAATVQVAVQNPQDVGGVSSAFLPFLISASTPTNPVPILTSVSPNSILVNSADTTITLTGSNFVSNSAVSINGYDAIPSSYQSSTTLTATIPSADLQTTGVLTIVVSNPAPGGGTSSSVAFSVEPANNNGSTAIEVTANSLAWDPVNQVIYLSLASSNTSNANSIQVLNPMTGTLGTAVSAGTDPNLLAVSESSKYLYAGLDGSNTVQRYNLPSLTEDISIPLGSDPAIGYSFAAMDLEASPVADGTAAIVLGIPGPGNRPQEAGGVQIYDDVTMRPNSLCGELTCSGQERGYLFDSIQWSPAGDEMYMLDNEDTLTYYTAPVTVSGFGSVTNYGSLGGGGTLHYDVTTGLLYTDSGLVINPATGATVGQIDIYGLAAPDGAHGLIFFLLQTTANAGTDTYTIDSFDINTLAPIGTYTVQFVIGTPVKLIRWGTNGLAFNTEVKTGSTLIAGVYLIQSSFVSTGVTPNAKPVENMRRSWTSRRDTSPALHHSSAPGPQ